MSQAFSSIAQKALIGLPKAKRMRGGIGTRTGLPARPDGLKSDPAAARWFDTLVDTLPHDAFAACDGMVLADLATMRARIDRLNLAINSKLAANAEAHISGLLVEARRTTELATKLATTLGLTPSGRARLPAPKQPEVPEDDPWDSM